VKRFLPEPVIAAMAGRRTVLNVRDTNMLSTCLA
jgi:hypothetical protein